VPGVPPELAAYLHEIVRHLRAILGPELVAVYCGGSVGLGGYLSQRSDVDVAAVSRATLTPEMKAPVVAALREDVLPCPARGLEFVLYSCNEIRSGTFTDFELEINDGPRQRLAVADSVKDKPALGGRFWYVLDRAVLRQNGIPLFGPQPHDLVGAPSRPDLLAGVISSLRWHLDSANGSAGDDAVLNACRGLRWARTGTWSDKETAGRWLLEQPAPRWCHETAAAGLLARRTGDPLERQAVSAFLVWCLRTVETDL
jgi:hypothetical protein